MIVEGSRSPPTLTRSLSGNSGGSGNCHRLFSTGRGVVAQLVTHSILSTRADMRYSVGMADRLADDNQAGGAVKERVRHEAKEPALYSVVLLNDDYTPMQFVVDVLEQVFQKAPAEAYRIMMQVHLNGRGVAGIYPWEVAETKIDTVLSRAREDGYPLQATIEDA
jgi:ATP-dependent Clp protease adaptor protein ClpS